MNELIVFDTNHSKSINDCELDYYSKKLATCSSDNTVKIFDVSLSKDPVCIAEIKDHNSAVWKVCWSHPKFGSLLASCSYDKSVIIYKEVSINKYEMIYFNNEHKSSVNYIEWSPHEYGLHLGCASSDGHISIISYSMNKDPNEGHWNKNSIKAHLNGTTCLSWEKPYNSLSNNKNLNDTDFINSFKLVSGGYDNQVIIWMFDNNTKEFHKIFQMNDKPHNSAIKDVSWRPNINNSTNIIASCSEEKIVILWVEDVSNNRWKNGQVIKLKHKIHKISWSPNGTILAIACSDENAYLYKENMEGIWEEICNLNDDNSLSDSFNLPNETNKNNFPINQENISLTNNTQFDEYNTSYMNENSNISSINMNYPNKGININNMHQLNYQNNNSFNSSSQENYGANTNSLNLQYGNSRTQENMNLNSSIQVNPIQNSAAQNNLKKNNPMQNNPIQNNPTQNISSVHQNNLYGQTSSPTVPLNPNIHNFKNNANQQNSSQSYLMTQNKKNSTSVASNINSFQMGIPPPPPPPPPSSQNSPYGNSNFSSQQLPNSSSNSYQPNSTSPYFAPPPPALTTAGTTNPMINKPNFSPSSQISTNFTSPQLSTFPKAATSSVQHPSFSTINTNKTNFTPPSQITNLPNSSNSMQPPQFQNINSNKTNFSAQPPPPPPPPFPSTSTSQTNVKGINKKNSFSNFNSNVNQTNIPTTNSAMQPTKNMNANYPQMGYHPPPPPPMNAVNETIVKPTNQFTYPNYNTSQQNTNINN
ncbi:protein transport protein SEC13, putative [Plasmodium gallinaceum]|uniref:Protein transport protein SEC13, putative n=1 Tax=Plasmodium gallinaceum TaxID=5849 RepID=A0A1J1GXH9_PLAGA|nr:protein transport protein SEC13, putative [Plasmodium gallinaceum]CRG96944.1 protein transport protein SEC13, putative [Plasmodium gallinaceum]